MPRQARLDSAGTLHHVMVRGIEKRTIVADERDRKNFVLRLGRLAHESGTLIYAWALMSDHAHILLRSGPHGLAKFSRRFSHRVRSRLQFAASSVRACIPEPVQIDRLRRGWLFYRTGTLHYCGHGVILGRIKTDWQERDEVLAQFGRREGEAKGAYRRYVEEGVALEGKLLVPSG
jgi:REP element-mobilizing transposase RayT